MPRQTLEGHRIVEELPVPPTLFVELLHLLEPLHRLFDREGLARSVGDHLCDSVCLRGLETECAADVADDRSGLHGPEGDDLSDGILTVLVFHVLDDLAPALVAEVDVDIRHRDPFWVEESLEEEPELQRVQVGDPERVGHDGARRRTSPRPYRNAVASRPVDEAPGDEEVTGIPGLGDDTELVVEPLLNGLREGVTIALLRAFRSQKDQVLVLIRMVCRQRELRKMVALLEAEVHLVRDLEGVLEHIGPVRKALGYLRCTLEVEALVVAHAPRVAPVLPEADAQQHIVGFMILGM